MEREWLTRQQRIDMRLRAAGWLIRPWPEVERTPLRLLAACAVTEYPTEHGPADYALIDGGRVVGIVEAKRVGVAPGNVLSQAERYARGLSSGPLRFGAFGAPFLYATNGEQIWFEDVRTPAYRSRHLAAFHTPAVSDWTTGTDRRAAPGELTGTLPHDRLAARPTPPLTWVKCRMG
jgi:type I restriction enzyme R subunit